MRINSEEIRGYFVGEQELCLECAGDVNESELTSDQFITEQDVETEDAWFFMIIVRR